MARHETRSATDRYGRVGFKSTSIMGASQTRFNQTQAGWRLVILNASVLSFGKRDVGYHLTMWYQFQLHNCLDVNRRRM